MNTKMDRLIAQQVKDITRAPYAFPGGYEKVLFLTDGECLCHVCVAENFIRIMAELSAVRRSDPEWRPAGVEINYEDIGLYCIHCGKRLKPEYSEEEEV